MGLLLDPIPESAVENAARGLQTLTASEFQVLRGILSGNTADEISCRTGLTKLTVQFYAKKILKKCMTDRVTLARMASELEVRKEVREHLTRLNLVSEEIAMQPEDPSTYQAHQAKLRTRSDTNRRPFQVRRRSISS